MIRIRRPWFRSIEAGYAYLNPLHNYLTVENHSIGPFGGGLPKKLAVGEDFSVYLTPIHEGLAGADYDRIGFTDTFNRFHWAPTRGMAETKAKIKAAYEAAPPSA